jgi:hypothetical protein
MIAKIVRIFPTVRITARTPLVDSTERIQLLGYIQRKTVIIDVSLMDEVSNIIDEEFLEVTGEFCLDNEPGYTDTFHHTHETQNIILTGSRRIATQAGGSFECISFT